MIGSFWESSATYLTVLTPLVAVPLTVITFYLRAIRESQLSGHAEWARRFEAVEASAGQARARIAEFERDYTTKEEWLRECMHARGRIEQLSEATVRLETLMERAMKAGQ